VERESDTTSVINGNWGFGFSVTQRAMVETIEKASRSGIAMATIRQQSHIGRLGGYATMAADRGMVAMMMADSGLGPKSVAPYGGRTVRLGTNPLCFSAPSGHAGAPVLLDMATSSVAVGKIKLAEARGEKIPEGWILDAHGNPTTDPGDYALGGAVLPLGGDQAHKGYGLSFIVEMFCGLLTGLGFGLDPLGRHNDGVFITVFDISQLNDVTGFEKLMLDFISYLKDTPLATGFTEILYPGELEHKTAQHRREHGIDVDDSTWSRLRALAESLGVTIPHL
jgi:uncharacterized oxidoreductase